jgi:hypothetical protein
MMSQQHSCCFGKSSCCFILLAAGRPVNVCWSCEQEQPQHKTTTTNTPYCSWHAQGALPVRLNTTMHKHHNTNHAAVHAAQQLNLSVVRYKGQP